jgi:phosphomannomutase
MKKENRLASKKEVTAVCEALNEENERLNRKVSALENELSELNEKKNIVKRSWEHMVWWYDNNCADAVYRILITSLFTIGGLSFLYYVIASLGMEFIPEYTEPVTTFIKRAVCSLLPW